LLSAAFAASLLVMRGRAIRACFGGGAVFLASTLAQAQCSKDTDCKGDRVCEAGMCTSPALPPAPPPPPGSEAPGTAAPAPGAATPPQPAPAAVNLQLQPTPSTELPPAATTSLGHDEPKTRRRSRPAMVTGIIMVSVGPISLLGALAAKNSQDRCDGALARDYPDGRLPTSEKYRVDDCNAYSVPFYVFGIGGALLTVAGIPLIIYGAKSLPLLPQSASVRVMPWASPDSGGLKLRLEM
jgi:hypothetical protein